MRANCGLTQKVSPLSASPPPPYPPTHPFLLAPIGPLFHTMSNVALGLEPAASKALTSFLSRPRVPTAFTEAAYPGPPSTDLEPLKLWAQQLPAPSPQMVHITVSDLTLRGKSWMHGRNQMLRLVHPAIRVVRFRFPVAALQDLCQQSSGKLIGTPTSSGHGFMTPKICSTAGLQILVSAMLHPRRDSLRPWLSGSGWC